MIKERKSNNCVYLHSVLSSYTRMVSPGVMDFCNILSIACIWTLEFGQQVSAIVGTRPL
jgi:hypothetical protein